MKLVETLNLKPEYENNPTAIEAFARGKFGNIDYWINEYRTRFYEQRDASGLALHDITPEELEKLKHKKAKITIELVTKPLCEYFKWVSGMAHFTDFEEDKYDYYSVHEETKRTTSWYTVRVVKQKEKGLN